MAMKINLPMRFGVLWGPLVMSVLCLHLLIASSTARCYFSKAFLIVEKWKCRPSSKMWRVGRNLFSGGVFNDIHYHSLWLVFLVFWCSCCLPFFMGEPNSKGVIVRLGTARCAALAAFWTHHIYLLLIILKYGLCLTCMSLKQLLNFTGHINLNTPYHYYIKIWILFLWHNERTTTSSFTIGQVPGLIVFPWSSNNGILPS